MNVRPSKWLNPEWQPKSQPLPLPFGFGPCFAFASANLAIIPARLTVNE